MATAEENRENVFKMILEILSNDSILCNYVRYMDYGKLVVKENCRLWETSESILNNNNDLNQSQIIRFVNNIDSKFFMNLTELHNSYINTIYGSRNGYGVLGLLRLQHAEAVRNNSSTQVEFDRYILERSVNIDYTLKIKGLSLTLLDFLNKNIKGVRSEKELFRDILYFVNKLIFIGDKCHLLAITDINDNVYVNTKCLENIFKLDIDAFKNAVLRLFKVINKFCIYFANNSITQYIGNMIEFPLLVDIYKNNVLRNVDGKQEQIKALSDFSFCETVETDDVIKNNIREIIESYTCRYLNNTCNIDSYDIPYLLRTLRENMSKMLKDKMNKSFTTGLSIYNICRQRGWELCNIEEEHISAYLHKDYLYIKKVMNIVPNLAFVTDGQGNIKKRVLKDEVIDEFHRKTGIEVKTIYLNITNGTMTADATHPNVSGYSVCMGDIKGKISFNDTTPDRISEMLSDCENLLTAINYTSPYNHNGESFFTSNEKSYDFGHTDAVENTDPDHPSVIENVKSYDEDEFSDEIDEEDTVEDDGL